MSLPLRPPLQPMLARSQATIPPGMAYEPKWDGFRCLVFRDNDEVALVSRNGRDLAGYFPEVVAAVLANTPPRCVLDSELVVVHGDRLDFERLSQRIHPAQSRIDLLSVTMPASLVCWDLLALDDDDLLQRPFRQRRELLERALQHSEAPVHLTPITEDLDLARVWFTRFEGAGLDGVVAKGLEAPYQPGQRAMIKVKHSREADVVVAGYRLHKNSTPQRPLLGSLQLGLFDASGVLQFVGVAAAFTEARRAELATEFAPLTLGPGDGPHPWAVEEVAGRRPGAVSRWSTELKETLLISPSLVCTVGYEHMEGTRFRHTAQFRRWRPDRDPESCTFDQLEEVVGYDLAEILGSDS
ncbi:MAG: ATP-dependent DNA ligase [Propionicimonas sp.]